MPHKDYEYRKKYNRERHRKNPEPARIRARIVRAQRKAAGLCLTPACPNPHGRSPVTGRRWAYCLDCYNRYWGDKRRKEADLVGLL